ncbi:hypothetical protein F5146DRAFT_1059011, partial [Armillaria mellea]
LYGVTNLQGVTYYRRYPDDWALDTVHVALSTYAVYVFLIHFFGDLNGALQYNSWYWQLALNHFLAVYIQGLYALRLWQLERNFHKGIAYFVPLVVLASLGDNIYITPSFPSASGLRTPIYIFFSTMAVTDAIIAIPMSYYLHKSRAIILVPSTSTVLLRLMRLVLMSGLATSACSLLILISFIVWSKSLAPLGIHFVLSKLYINSLLAMLNSRSKHHSTSQSTVTEDEVHASPTFLRITPLSSERNVSETHSTSGQVVFFKGSR